MSTPRYPEEFKIQANNQVTEKKLTVADAAAHPGVSTHSLISAGQSQTIPPRPAIQLAKSWILKVFGDMLCRRNNEHQCYLG